MFSRYVEEQQRFTHMLLAECDVICPPDCNYNLRCVRCVCRCSIDKTHICHWGWPTGVRVSEISRTTAMTSKQRFDLIAATCAIVICGAGANANDFSSLVPCRTGAHRVR